jgi:hypothetical protein
MSALFRGPDPERGVEPIVPPGREALLTAAVAIGIVLLAIQLWLLTVALDIYLAGDRGQLWVLAVLSGVVFVGGIVAIRVISRGPRTTGRR